MKKQIVKNSIKKTKNPWIAAILNFILPGLGYFYAGKKKMIVSFGFLILSIWVAIHDWNEITRILSGKISITEHFLLFIILYPIVFAYDAYFDAMLFNKYIANKNKSN